MQKHDPILNSENLKNKCHNLNNLLQRSIAKKEILVKEELLLTKNIIESKNRLEVKDEVKNALNVLQNETQKKTMDTYSDLLTYMVHDVLPKNEDEKIDFQLTSKRGKPNLDIFVKVGEDEFEDVYYGRGGSLVNIISTGLRFVVLSRTRNRRFMLLDEADCWLNNESVPRFSKTISDLSRKIGIQTLSISHKNPDFYNGRVIELTRNKKTKRVSAKIIKDPEDNDEFLNNSDYDDDINKTNFIENIGIKKIKLKNFMSLENVEIPLSPTMNVIVGEVDIGKSAIFTAISTFVENKGNNSMITHGKDHFEIEFIIEDDISLKMIYKKKGAKKTKYEMTIPGEKTISEENGQSLPDFIDECLAIRSIDGINIQLAHQKQPVFMIGPETTSSQRAELLSLGRESDYIQKMINKHGEEVKKDSKVVKEDGQKILKIKNVLEKIDNIESIDLKLKEIINSIDEISKMEEETEYLETIGKKIKNINDQLNVLKEIKNIEKIELKTLPNDNNDQLISDGISLKNMFSKINILKNIKNIEKPIINNNSELLNSAEYESNLGNKISDIFNNIKKIENEMEISNKEIENCKKDNTIFLEKIGNMCPLCKQKLNHKH